MPFDAASTLHCRGWLPSTTHQDSQLNLMRATTQPPPRNAFRRWALILLGLGSLMGALFQLHPVARMRIQLERNANREVEGSMSFVLAGIPIFWLSLDGLTRLEEQTQTHSHTVKGVYRGEMTTSRLGLMNATGATIAWTDRIRVKNQTIYIEQFLNGAEPRFEYLEDPAPTITFWHIERILWAVAIAFGGLLFILAALDVPVWSLLRFNPWQRNKRPYLP